MYKTVLVTGSTDGIGLEAAKMLAGQGHTVLLHGRNRDKLDHAARTLSTTPGHTETYLADLSRMADVEALAEAVADKHTTLDALINNAGIFRTSNAITGDGLDVRFAVNTIAPYLLTRRLQPHIGTSGRVVNVSSAAQAAVDPDALAGRVRLADMDAYGQSKLAIIMWTRHLATEDESPVIIAVNPGSMLGTKMVKEGFGVTGGDVRIGADILVRAAVSEEFADASGQYYDNDSGRFAPPHAEALDTAKCRAIVGHIETILAGLGSKG